MDKAQFENFKSINGFKWHIDNNSVSSKSGFQQWITILNHVLGRHVKFDGPISNV